MISLRKEKSLKSIAHEWDMIASLREDQVQSGKDHSANFVLAPAILSRLPSGKSLIDIGCGTGWLTSRAAEVSTRTVGIDPSEGSIAIAESMHAAAEISYHAMSVEDYSRNGQTFDVAISNMAASSSPDLTEFFLGTRKVLNKNGRFIMTIPHPCFWPLYWGYASHASFRYEESFAVEGNFKIQNESSEFTTTHFHHPLHFYFEALSAANFQVEKMVELAGLGFSLPRFLLIEAEAI